jgi:hypothetical protein
MMSIHNWKLIYWVHVSSNFKPSKERWAIITMLPSLWWLQNDNLSLNCRSLLSKMKSYEQNGNCTPNFKAFPELWQSCCCCMCMKHLCLHLCQDRYGVKEGEGVKIFTLHFIVALGEPAGFCGKSLSSKVLLNLKNCFLKLHQRFHQIKNCDKMHFCSLCDFIGFWVNSLVSVIEDNDLNNLYD